MKRRDRRVTGTNAGNLIKVIWRNLYKPTGHAAATMINDSRDRWHIRLLIFQYKKRSRSLSWKENVNEIIQQQWLIHGCATSASAPQVDRNASWSEKKGEILLSWNDLWTDGKNKAFYVWKDSFEATFSSSTMNIHKGPETVHYLPWHKCSSLDSRVNYLSHLLHAKWCNSHERLGEIVTFLCLFLQHQTSVDRVHVHSCGTVFFFLCLLLSKTLRTSLSCTCEIWCYVELNVEWWASLLLMSPWNRK